MRIEMDDEEIAEAIQTYVNEKHGINRVVRSHQITWHADDKESGDEVQVDLTHVMISLPEPEGSY